MTLNESSHLFDQLESIWAICVWFMWEQRRVFHSNWAATWRQVTPNKQPIKKQKISEREVRNTVSRSGEIQMTKSEKYCMCQNYWETQVTQNKQADKETKDIRAAALWHESSQDIHRICATIETMYLDFLPMSCHFCLYLYDQQLSVFNFQSVIFLSVIV